MWWNIFDFYLIFELVEELNQVSCATKVGLPAFIYIMAGHRTFLIFGGYLASDSIGWG